MNIVIIKRTPLWLTLLLTLCQPEPVPATNAFLFGPGIGETTVEGDYNRTVKSNAFQIGLDLDSEDWLFIFTGASATDDRFKSMKLLGGWGNRYFKIGTGFRGMQSSIPTVERNLHIFLRTSAEKDTAVSATTIPVFFRFTPLRTQTWQFNLDAYYGLYSTGSMTLPVKTIIPDKLAYVSTKPKKTGGTYGGTISLQYRFQKDMGLRLDYTREWGRMDRGQTTLDKDFLNIVGPIETPQLNFHNEAVYLTLVILTD